MPINNEEVEMFEAQYKFFNTIDVQNQLFTKFSPWKYENREDILQIYQFLFSIYEEKLNFLVKEHASFAFLDFCFSQFHISHLTQKNEQTVALWSSRKSIIKKQMYKYLIELIIKCNPTLLEVVVIDLEQLNEIICLAEEVFTLANNIADIRSGKEIGYVELTNTQTNGTTFNNYVWKNVDNELFIDYGNQDIKLFHDKFHKIFSRFDIDFQYDFLNLIFEQEFGYSYQLYVHTISLFGDPVFLQTASKTDLGTCIWLEEDIYLTFTSQSVLNKDQIEQILNSVTLDYSNIQDRRIFKPDAQYRLYSRFLVKCEFNWKLHYFRNSLMTQQNVFLLLNNFMSGIVPPEIWSPKIISKVNKMRLAFTKKFEICISNQLKEFWFKGSKRKENKSYNKNWGLVLPSEKVGEIDWIGINPQGDKIILLEFKMNKLASVSIQQANEVQKFDEYITKFINKIKWVEENLNEIKSELEILYNIDLQNAILEPTLVSENPSICKIIEKRVKVISFPSFLEEIEASINDK